MGGMGASADADDVPTGRSPAPHLPEPTGPYLAGTASVWLTDTSRPDPWVSGVDARELMVSLWYPAVPSDGRRALYMTPAESEFQLTSRGITSIPPDTLSRVETNAVSDARPAGRQHSHPLVVLSPGFTNSRSALTALAEDLASHGYVVAGIDHTYESYATAFPDGRVTTCLAREAPRRDRKDEVAATRAADVSFVLDRADQCAPGLAGRRADRPVPDGDGRPLRRRRRRHRRDAGRLAHPRGHRYGRLHCRPDPGRRPGTAISVPGQAIQLHPGERRRGGTRDSGVESSERRGEHLGAGLGTADRLEAVACGGRGRARLLHRPGAAGRPDRHRHRRRPIGNAVPGDHPRLRPSLLRPALAWQAAGPAGRAVTALPRGQVLHPVSHRARTASGHREVQVRDG